MIPRFKVWEAKRHKPHPQQATFDWDKPMQEEPNAEKHDEIHRELQRLYRTQEYRQGDRPTHKRVGELEDQLAFHKPAAIARAEQEIARDKAQREKWEQPAPKPYQKPYKSAPDLAGEYKQRGLSRQLAWDQYVKDTILSPVYRTDAVDAKEFYRYYDSV